MTFVLHLGMQHVPLIDFYYKKQPHQLHIDVEFWIPCSFVPFISLALKWPLLHHEPPFHGMIQKRIKPCNIHGAK
jgi:hypothetical protein